MGRYIRRGLLFEEYLCLRLFSEGHIIGGSLVCQNGFGLTIKTAENTNKSV